MLSLLAPACTGLPILVMILAGMRTEADLTQVRIFAVFSTRYFIARGSTLAALKLLA